MHILARFARAAQKYIFFSAIVFYLAQILGTVLIIIADALSPIEGMSKNIIVITYIVGGVLYLISVLIQVIKDIAFKSVDIGRLFEAEEDIDDLHENLYVAEEFASMLTYQQVCLQASLSILHCILDEIHGHTLTQEQALGKILNPLISNCHEALNYTAFDYYNFTIYMYNDKIERLSIAFRECDSRIQRRDREWTKNQGHSAAAFHVNKTIVTSDIEESPDLNQTHNIITDELDLKQYRSFISSPFYTANEHPHTLEDKPQPIGVFCVTSNRPGHFTNAEKVIIDQYSLLFSLYFSLINKLENNHVANS
jgi:hypothetical protein